ncbi:MAG TPA: diguanylate cyclase [Flavobacteriales bacterium]|jgi:L-methionine (R)-S-oxide reductase|nr:diguanylate cyclase [Flavobacteriales bacterium]
MNNLGIQTSYDLAIQEIELLIKSDSNSLAVLGNVISNIHFKFKFFWTGIYIVEGDELVLHVFQGPVACTRIAYGKGVCGTAWRDQRTVIVPDVHQFEGHIACSSESKSEVVIPVFKDGKVIAVLDVDSDKPDAISNDDAVFLEEVAKLISKVLS